MTRQPHALVTGASRGLGRALTVHLSRRGWRVLVDARDAADLAAVATLPSVTAVAGDVADANHRRALADAIDPADGLDLLVNNASLLGPSPLPALTDYPTDALEQVLRVNVVAPLDLVAWLAPVLRPGARLINVTSDAAVEPYPGWGGYGASKAALDQLTAVLGVEHPDWRVYAFDPGDLRTAMHQAAHPGEDISDRPEPETVLPALDRLITGDLPTGRYRAADLGGLVDLSDLDASDTSDPASPDLLDPAAPEPTGVTR